jgi:hypothetical protein
MFFYIVLRKLYYIIKLYTCTNMSTKKLRLKKIISLPSSNNHGPLGGPAPSLKSTILQLGVLNHF